VSLNVLKYFQAHFIDKNFSIHPYIMSTKQNPSAGIAVTRLPRVQGYIDENPYLHALRLKPSYIFNPYPPKSRQKPA
jgi:cobyric acid synthase